MLSRDVNEGASSPYQEPGQVPYQQGSRLTNPLAGQQGTKSSPDATGATLYDDRTDVYQPIPQTYHSSSYTDPRIYAASQLGTPYGQASTGSIPPVKPSKKGLRTGAIIALALVLAIVFGTGLFAGWQFGHNGSTVTANPTASGLQSGNSTSSSVPPVSGTTNIEQQREAVVAQVRPTVVQVNVQIPQGSATGSGVIIDKRGYIVTNDHVVNGAQNIQVVLSDGTKLPAQLTGTDQTDDLAVIKINPPANMAVAKLGDSSKLMVGQDVLAIGNPLGITQTVTNGIVSALGRQVDEGQNGVTIPNAIQTDAPINPGNSGGALVDLQGNLVGIPTLTAIDPEFNTPANGVGFAIPSNRVNYIVPQIIQSGKVSHSGRAALGVSVASVDQVMAAQNNLAIDHGALITSLVAGGPAEKAGLRVGDVIVQLDGKDVNDISSLSDIMATKNLGDKVPVKVYRGTQQL
ncbi:MAG TPA: trypsin-like peptidase domain-containing protein, partial [Ktedonobacteraceae bacterium]